MSEYEGTPEDRLTELGVPPDAVQELVDRRIGQAIQVQAAALNNPHVQYLRQHDAEITQALNANPAMAARVANMARADVVAAVEYLSLAHQAARGGRPGAGPPTPPAEPLQDVHGQYSRPREDGRLTSWPGAGDGQVVTPDRTDVLMRNPEAVEELRQRAERGDTQAVRDYVHVRLRRSGVSDHVWQ